MTSVRVIRSGVSFSLGLVGPLTGIDIEFESNGPQSGPGNSAVAHILRHDFPVSRAADSIRGIFLGWSALVVEGCCSEEILTGPCMTVDNFVEVRFS